MATNVMCVCHRVDAESSGYPEGGSGLGVCYGHFPEMSEDISWVRHTCAQQLLGALVFLRSYSFALCTRPPHLRVPIRESSDGTWIARVSVVRVVLNTGTFRKRCLHPGDTRALVRHVPLVL